MAADDDQPQDTAQKVKDLAAAFARASAPRPAPADGEEPPEEELDPQTRADLERWFGLPSYQELAERPTKPEEPVDPEMVALVERRERALAAIDPALVEAHRRRVEPAPEDELPRQLPPIHTYADPDMTMFDQAAVERAVATIADAREIEIPQTLIDDLHECTPQAILRDLHRPEFDFQKIFEIVDHGADLKLDIGGTVGELMGTRYGLLPSPSVWAEARAGFGEVTAILARPWVDVLSTELVYRREGLS
jgi:hypothetical protein